ncbi:CD99 antigen-like protein 2 isoform X1 [Heptranchias perlo]|uniref:CD99 antigen-like protein 2 isoform X1 n=1 Tax=Heptranchias perlo TaxID=212740 RepID=UPI00355999A9
MLLLKSLLFVCLTFVFVRTNEDDGFDLSDALEGEHTEPWDDHDGFDLNDALKDGPTKPLSDDDGFDLNDAFSDGPTKPLRNDDGFDLSEALNDDPIKPAGGDFSDSDLQDVVDGDYKADKTNSKGQDPPTPLDLISDLVMVVIGGTSEQIKRLCLSLLEMLTEQYSNAQDQ